MQFETIWPKVGQNIRDANELWVSFVLIGPYWSGFLLTTGISDHKTFDCGLPEAHFKDLKNLQNHYGHPEYFGPSGPLWFFWYFLTSNLNIRDKAKLSSKGSDHLAHSWGVLGRFLGSQWDRDLKFSAYASFLILWSLSKFELI